MAFDISIFQVPIRTPQILPPFPLTHTVKSRNKNAGGCPQIWMLSIQTMTLTFGLCWCGEARVPREPGGGTGPPARGKAASHLCPSTGLAPCLPRRAAGKQLHPQLRARPGIRSLCPAPGMPQELLPSLPQFNSYSQSCWCRTNLIQISLHCQLPRLTCTAAILSTYSKVGNFFSSAFY